MNSMAKGDKDNLLERFMPILLLVSVVLAFAVGVLWQKVSVLENGGSANVVGNQEGAAQPSGDAPTQGKLSKDQADKIPEVTSDDHIRGSEKPQAYLIEYSDFQCPYCSQFHPTAQKVLDEYKDQVAWVYRHFPLDQLHPQARPAAKASECVAELGGEDAFWQFADTVFADQEGTLNDLSSVASGLGINVNDFNTCVSEDRYAGLVEEVYQKGLSAGVTGTPGNFIVNENGDAWFIPGALPYEAVKKLLDEALQG